MLPKNFRLYLRDHRVARLATLNKDNSIHLIPIVFANDSGSIYFAVDQKPKRTKKLRRLQNIDRSGNATILIDDYSEDWTKLSYSIIYAKAEVLHSEQKLKARAIRLLREKYSQYASGKYLPNDSRSTVIVRLSPGKIVQWSAESALESTLT